MDLEKLFNSNKAVSPVIGVVLMVAITVILAAAVGSSVFGQSPAKSAPQADINIQKINTTAIKLEHLGGDTISFDPEVTKIMFEIGGTSYQVSAYDFKGTSAYTPFDVGMTKTLMLYKAKADGSLSTDTITVASGSSATVKIIDVKTRQLIVHKELIF
jgi:flagellin-like protein